MNDLYTRVVEASEAIRPDVPVSPLVHSTALSDRTGCVVYLKCEHVQETGSFKLRGAVNKLRLLAATQCKRVVTASTGNHGLAVALAGRRAAISVVVYAPMDASSVKLDAIRALGAQVITIDAPPLQVELEAARRGMTDGLPFISPYNDLDVIAGQGTIGIELAEQHPNLAAIFVSVGGGGLIAGIGTALKEDSPKTKVVGCWPRNAPALYECLKAGRVIEVDEAPTISDATAGGVAPDSVTLPIVQQVMHDAVLIPEDQITQAMKLVAQTERWMIGKREFTST